jgi:hypothetical protein
MNNHFDKGEIILYQADDKSTQLEVRVDAETVWLNRHQIALLFDRDVKTIGTYKVEYYNLDMIISLSYRLIQISLQMKVYFMTVNVLL